MEDTDALSSRIAPILACIRAYHAMHDTPKIFDDFLAYRLLTEEERAFNEQLLARSLKLYDPVRAASCPDKATALAWSIRAMPSPPMVVGRATVCGRHP